MKRKVITYNTNSPTGFVGAVRGRTFTYRLDCGHTLSGDYRRSWKGQMVQPKTLDCRQCDDSGPLHKF